MWRWPRQYGLWITLGSLAFLLLLLGVLQYRWIGEIGRAEAERQKAQIARSANRFAAGLDRALGQVMLALHGEPRSEPAGPGMLDERLALLSRSDEARLVSRVLRLRPRAGAVSLEDCTVAGPHCQPGTWTPALETLRRRLLAREEAGGSPFESGIRPGEMLDDPPALLLPDLEREDTAPRQAGPQRLRLDSLLVIELDTAYLRGTLLPQLAEACFGPLRESEFAVSVVRRADRHPLYSSAPTDRGEGSRGDLELEIPGFLRPNPEREGRRRFPGFLFGAWRERERRFDSAPAEAPWLLVVRHRGGSLDHAVTAMRRRNLALSLGVLALLGAAAIVLVIGAQRARSLARQQIELVAGVSHELNTPLAAIRSAGENLAEGIVTDPAQVRRYGASIEQQGRRLTGLVAQVLDFAGIESMSRAYASEPVSLPRLVDDALAELHLVLEQAGLVVLKVIPADLPELRGDAPALRRVLANLLTNAAKFAAAGGRATIRAHAVPGRKRVVLRVEDAGPGIPAAERARVFEPFYRGGAAGRNEVPGSGLGLALVRRVVTAHGGSVRIEEAAGGGTAVVVELPAAGQGEPS